MLLFLAGFLVTYVLVVGLERLAAPQPQTPPPLIHRMSVLTATPAMVCYLTLVMISYRPVFSAVVTAIIYLTIIVLNNAKYAALREPLVFSDFALLRQAIAYPALYVRYIGAFKIVLVVTAALLTVIAGFRYEPPLVAREEPTAYFPTVIYLFLLTGLIYAVTRGPLRKPMRDFLLRFGPTTDATRDKDQLSLVVCLILYFFLANEPERPESRQQRHAAKRREVRADRRGRGSAMAAHPRFREGPLPDVVTVQSESFFDVRRLSPAIPPDVLQAFDRVAGQAAYRGHLHVPAFGANTMRSEFAFLSGLPNEALGVHRFNPYLQLGKSPIWTIATQLRMLGYRTVCIHPFESSFFDRASVYPNLGFDSFLDIASFGDAECAGPYVCDRAVADKIQEVLGTHDGPQFVFAITMENHGKWTRDRLAGMRPYVDLDDPPLGSVALGVYLHHLYNADAMIDRIASELESRSGDSVFCLFGDHLPSLPDVFDRAGFTETSTDYFVWKKNSPDPRTLDVGADALNRLVLDAALNEVAAAPPVQAANQRDVADGASARAVSN